MTFGPKQIVCTDEFSIVLGLENDEMQDPNEFTRLLFDRMHESFQKYTSAVSPTSPHSKYSAHSLGNLFLRLLGGICHYETTCLQCDQKSTQKEDFMDLTLPFAEAENPRVVSHH